MGCIILCSCFFLAGCVVEMKYGCLAKIISKLNGE